MSKNGHAFGVDDPVGTPAPPSFIVGAELLAFGSTPMKQGRASDLDKILPFQANLACEIALFILFEGISETTTSDDPVPLRASTGCDRRAYHR